MKRLNKIGKVCQVNNLVIFNGKPIGSEEFLNRTVKALGVTIVKCPKGRPRKREN